MKGNGNYQINVPGPDCLFAASKHLPDIKIPILPAVFVLKTANGFPHYKIILKDRPSSGVEMLSAPAVRTVLRLLSAQGLSAFLAEWLPDRMKPQSAGFANQSCASRNVVAYRTSTGIDKI